MEFSVGTIVAVLGACGGLITVSVPVLKIISERIDAKKQEKIEIKKLEQSNAANLHQLENERQETEREDLRTLVEFYKEQCKLCQQQLEEAENGSLVSRPKRRELSALLLKINRNIYMMEKGFEEKFSVGELKAIFMSIKKQFTELEDLMS